MFEVEKKFILTAQQEKALIENAEFLGEKEFTDIYYDDANYTLTGQDLWLRSRDKKFELKIPMNKKLKERVSDQYKELETESEILQYFEPGRVGNLLDFLAEKKYVPFCQITTTRKKYKKDGFNIDLDITNFGYTIAEIEYMVSEESNMEDATRAIIGFAKKHKIDTESIVRGKVVEYLRINNPKHFEALITLGVIR